MSNFKRKTTSGYEAIPIDADKLGGTTLEQIKALINGKQASGNYVSFASNTVTVAGTSESVATLSPGAVYVPNGLVMGGTAAAAGLATRGICGIGTPDAKGACSKENLYLNYDGNNDYSRPVVLGAGSPGDAMTGGAHTLSAVRGDQMASYVSNAISGKANSSHTHSIANVTGLQSALDGKASKEYVDTAISGVTQFDVVKVDSFDKLPATGKKGVIYLVPDSHSDSNDVYDEYIWNTAVDKPAYEKIGNTDVNLSGYVTLGTEQAITGKKTFKAPANSNGVEQATAVFKTANGGQIIFGKEGPNSGSMIALDQVDGTRRLNFRASATPGAIVWSQPESGSALFYDVANVYFRQTGAVTFDNASTVRFSRFASASALGTDANGNLKKVTLATVATSGSYNDLSNKPTIPDISGKADKSSLATVATSGKYSDLSGTPVIDANIDGLTSGHVPDSNVLKGVNIDVKANKSMIDSIGDSLTALKNSLSDYRKKTDTILTDDVICNIRDQDFDQGTLSNYLDELYDRIYNLQNASVPAATSSAYGGIKIGYGESGRNYAVKLDSNGKAYVNVPWTDTISSGSSYTLPSASSTVRGGVMLTAGHSGDSNVYESFYDVKVESTNYHVFIRAGRFKQTSGSASSSTQFTFKKAMSTFGSSASKVSVILGDSSGQSTSGGYMGSLAVDSASSTGFKYRASNTEKGYVFYLAIGTY